MRGTHSGTETLSLSLFAYVRVHVYIVSQVTVFACNEHHVLRKRAKRRGDSNYANTSGSEIMLNASLINTLVFRRSASVQRGYEKIKEERGGEGTEKREKSDTRICLMTRACRFFFFSLRYRSLRAARDPT